MDENGKQNHPPGFQLIILPYAEEIRDIPAEVKSLPGNTKKKNFFFQKFRSDTFNLAYNS